MKSHWLPALRKVLGLSKAAMARELGVTRARVWQIERNGGSLDGEKLARVWERHGPRLRGMGYSLADLLSPAPPDDPGQGVAAS